jgi:hypothetical protein
VGSPGPHQGGPASLDIGANYAYPEATHAERERIVDDHRRYQQGLMWTLADHPRVRETVQRLVN